MENKSAVTEAIFAAIKSLSKRGYPPTLREIGHVVGMDHVGLWRHHILPLIESGHLEWPIDAAGRHISRGIRLTTGEKQDNE